MKNVTCTWVSIENTKEAAFKHSKKQKKPQMEKSENIIRPPTLKSISLEIKKGSLVGIIGHVGSGKSSLLQVILKELEIESGSLMVNGKTSYTSQVILICPKVGINFSFQILGALDLQLINTTKYSFWFGVQKREIQ